MLTIKRKDIALSNICVVENRNYPFFFPKWTIFMGCSLMAQTPTSTLLTRALHSCRGSCRTLTPNIHHGTFWSCSVRKSSICLSLSQLLLDFCKNKFFVNINYVIIAITVDDFLSFDKLLPGKLIEDKTIKNSNFIIPVKEKTLIF